MAVCMIQQRPVPLVWQHWRSAASIPPCGLRAQRRLRAPQGQGASIRTCDVPFRPLYISSSQIRKLEVLWEPRSPDYRRNSQRTSEQGVYCSGFIHPTNKQTSEWRNMKERATHISSPPELRRKLEGRIEPDDQPDSDAAMFEQHLARVCTATAEVIQKSRKSEGHNAAEGIALMGGAGRGASARHTAQRGCWLRRGGARQSA